MKKLFYLLLFFCFVSCATLFEKSLKFHEMVARGEFEQADSWIAGNKKFSKPNNQILQILNRGYLNRMMGNYNESIEYFNNADLQIEDYRKNYRKEALALISNPTVTPYRVEDFEAVMLHYYQAINYYQIGNYEDAIVECKRMNLILQQLDDKFKDHKNKYQRDAFGHLLMGIIYEANGNLNDAFIAYRNAYEIYKSDYRELFQTLVPEQLKKDILRTAYRLGFSSELRMYEKEFNMLYEDEKSFANLVFFWENGFGPVKSEWSVFLSTHVNNGIFYMNNDELDLAFNFYIGNESAEKQNAYQRMSFIRVAFPKYKERKPVYGSAILSYGGKNYGVYECQEVNDIAFQSLKDRMVREVAVTAARLATKKMMEGIANSQNAYAGAAVSIANAVTEKADTRNWQTLPYSVSYSRIPLNGENNQVMLNTNGIFGGADITNFDIKAKKGETVVHFFHSLATEP